MKQRSVSIPTSSHTQIPNNRFASSTASSSSKKMHHSSKSSKPTTRRNSLSPLMPFRVATSLLRSMSKGSNGKDKSSPQHELYLDLMAERGKDAFLGMTSPQPMVSTPSMMMMNDVQRVLQRSPSAMRKMDANSTGGVYELADKHGTTLQSHTTSETGSSETSEESKLDTDASTPRSNLSDGDRGNFRRFGKSASTLESRKTNRKLAVFKPEDEETGAITGANRKLVPGDPNPARAGLVIGGGAKRERAAYVLDRTYGGFSGVPPTQLARLRSRMSSERHNSVNERGPSLPATGQHANGSGVGQLANSTGQLVKSTATECQGGGAQGRGKSPPQGGQVTSDSLTTSQSNISPTSQSNISPTSRSNISPVSQPTAVLSQAMSAGLRHHTPSSSASTPFASTPPLPPQTSTPPLPPHPTPLSRSRSVHGSIPQDMPQNGRRRRHRNKRGSIQKYCENDGSADDRYDLRSKASPLQVHKIGVLDLRIFNTDRHGGNILCAVNKETEAVDLIPIDHALSLPDWHHLGEAFFDWQYWPQAQVPFGDLVVSHIKNLDIAKDLDELRGLRIGEEYITTYRICTTALKVGVANGVDKLTDFGDMFHRPYSAGHPKHDEYLSPLEHIVVAAASKVGIPYPVNNLQDIANEPFKVPPEEFYDHLKSQLATSFATESWRQHVV